MSNSDLIEKIRHGDDTSLKMIYRDFRVPFVKWIIQKFAMSEVDALELFQFSVVTTYDNIVRGTLHTLEGSLKTYIFSIGRNKAMEMSRHHKKMIYDSDQFLFDYLIQDDNQDRKAQEENFIIVDQALQQLGDPGKSILTLYYYQRLSMQQIAIELDYKNANTVKNLKYKCLQRLQSICQQLKGQGVKDGIVSG